MFGGTDLNDISDSSPFVHFIAWVSFGRSTQVRRTASPINYVDPGDPQFLIFQGADDEDVLPRQSVRLAEKLVNAGVPVTYIEVKGAGHVLNNPDQHPSAWELALEVVDFFVKALR